MNEPPQPLAMQSNHDHSHPCTLYMLLVMMLLNLGPSTATRKQKKKSTTSTAALAEILDSSSPSRPRAASQRLRSMGRPGRYPELQGATLPVGGRKEGWSRVSEVRGSCLQRVSLSFCGIVCGSLWSRCMAHTHTHTHAQPYAFSQRGGSCKTSGVETWFWVAVVEISSVRVAGGLGGGV